MMVSLVVELGDDVVELLEGEALVGGGLLVDVGGVDEFEEVVVVDGVVELLGDGLELLEVDDSVLVLVVEGEDPLDAVLGLGLAHPRGDDVDELILADGLVLVLESVDEVQDEGVSLVQAQLLQNLVDLHWVDGPASVLVEHLERVHQLVVVLGCEAVLPGSRGRLGDLG